MASKGIKINLGRFLINKMFKVLKDEVEEAKGKQKSTQHLIVSVPYVTLITFYVKSLGIVNPRNEMLPLVVTYNVASIAKMGYNDNNNNGIFFKIQRVGDDNDGEEQAPATQDAQAPAPPAYNPAALSLIDIMGVLTMLTSLRGFKSKFGLVLIQWLSKLLWWIKT